MCPPRVPGCTRLFTCPTGQHREQGEHRDGEHGDGGVWGWGSIGIGEHRDGEHREHRDREHGDRGAQETEGAWRWGEAALHPQGLERPPVTSSLLCPTRKKWKLTVFRWRVFPSGSPRPQSAVCSPITCVPVHWETCSPRPRDPAGVLPVRMAQTPSLCPDARSHAACRLHVLLRPSPAAPADTATTRTGPATRTSPCTARLSLGLVSLSQQAWPPPTCGSSGLHLCPQGLGPTCWPHLHTVSPF